MIRENSFLQVGLRGQVYSSHDFEFAEEQKVEIITAEQFHAHGMKLFREKLQALHGKPVYVTLDIDCVDPAFAPGTGTPQVGGFSSAQIVELVRGLRGLKLVGCDLVEVSPPYDNGSITSLLAANLLYELLCVF